MKIFLSVISGIIQNLAVLFSIVFLLSYLPGSMKKVNVYLRSVIIGIFLGIAAVINMRLPIVFFEGTIVDSKTIIVCLSSLFGGIITGISSLVVASLYRMSVGGIGAVPGINSMIIAFALGALVHMNSAGRLLSLKYYHLLIIGFIVAVTGILWRLAMPFEVVREAIYIYSLPIIIYFPLVMLVIGSLIIHYMKKDETVRMYSEAVEQSPGGVCFFDEGLKYIGSNSKFCEMFEFAGDEYIEYATSLVRNIYKHDADFPIVSEIELEHRDSVISWVSLSLMKLSDSRILVLNIEDISRKKKIELSIKMYQDKLEEIIRERSIELESRNSEIESLKEKIDNLNVSGRNFITSMEHDIRTPFNSIIGFAKLLRKEENSNQDKRNKLDIIINNSEKLLSMMEYIFEMSRLESGMISIENNSFDFSLLLSDILNRMKPLFSEKGIELFFDKKTGGSNIFTDDRKVKFIISSFMKFFLEYSDKGFIKLTVNDDIGQVNEKGSIKFTIESGDNFRNSELFMQNGDDAESDDIRILISKKYIKLLDGKFKFGRTEHGSFIDVTIPVEGGVITESTTGSKNIVDNPGAYKILVVDDQDENSFLLKELLEEKGFFVKTVSNGLSAVREANIWHPDLIFMDWRMPKMNGLEATKCIRDMPECSDIKIIALTAHIFDEFKKEMLDAGADDFIRKPFEEEEIDTALEKHLVRKNGSAYYTSEQLSNSHQKIESVSESLKGIIRDAAGKGLSDEIIKTINSDTTISLSDRELILKLTSEYKYDELLKLLS